MPDYAATEPAIQKLRCMFLSLTQFIKFESLLTLFVLKYFFWKMQQLPVKIYESIIDIVQGETTMLFVDLQYTLATEEAERIGVDHVVRTSIHENGGKSAGNVLCN